MLGLAEEPNSLMSVDAPNSQILSLKEDALQSVDTTQDRKPISDHDSDRSAVDSKHNSESPGRSPLTMSEETKVYEDLSLALVSVQSHKDSFAFWEPVDPVRHSAPGYFDVVSKPMDFGTITANLQNCVYKDPNHVLDDIVQVFTNCYIYNPPSNPITAIAERYEQAVRSALRRYVPSLVKKFKWESRPIQITGGRVSRASSQAAKTSKPVAATSFPIMGPLNFDDDSELTDLEELARGRSFSDSEDEKPTVVQRQERVSKTTTKRTTATSDRKTKVTSKRSSKVAPVPASAPKKPEPQKRVTKRPSQKKATAPVSSIPVIPPPAPIRPPKSAAQFLKSQQRSKAQAILEQQAMEVELQRKREMEEQRRREIEEQRIRELEEQHRREMEERARIKREEKRKKKKEKKEKRKKEKSQVLAMTQQLLMMSQHVARLVVKRNEEEEESDEDEEGESPRHRSSQPRSTSTYKKRPTMKDDFENDYLPKKKRKTTLDTDAFSKAPRTKSQTSKSKPINTANVQYANSQLPLPIHNGPLPTSVVSTAPDQHVNAPESHHVRPTQFNAQSPTKNTTVPVLPARPVSTEEVSIDDQMFLANALNNVTEEQMERVVEILAEELPELANVTEEIELDIESIGGSAAKRLVSYFKTLGAVAS